MNQQKIVVFHEALLEADSIFASLSLDFHFTHIHNLNDAGVYLKNQRPDLVIFKLNKYLGEKAHPLSKLRRYFSSLPILLLCEQLSRDERIEIHRIDKVFAFDLSLEKNDFSKYLQKIYQRSSRARSFVRFARSRALSVEFEDKSFAASFIDYSQTGAQIKMKEFSLRLKSRVLVSYLSRTSQKIRQIESYVVWANPESGRIGLQFLAVR